MELADIADKVQRYDARWWQIDAALLKKTAVLWGGSAKMRKDECVTYLLDALEDVTLVDATLARMRPYERAALGILKLVGSLDFRALSVAMRTTGTTPTEELPHASYRRSSLGETLIERSIVMRESDYFSSSYTDSNTERAFADERLLARITPLEHVPFAIQPAELPLTATFRRPQSVALDVLAMLQAVASLGGIGLTKAGDVRVNDVRKFARKMGWGEQIAFDGLTFPDPSGVFLPVLAFGGLLTTQDDLLKGAATQEELTQRSTADLAQALVRGILGASKWEEQGASANQYWFAQRASAGRAALLTALCCLPSPRAWLALGDFERLLFARIGEYHSIGTLPNEPYLYGKSPTEIRTLLAEWREKLRASWKTSDLPWIQAAFKTWLYAFGLVELSLRDGAVERFRLTDLGRAVFRYESAVESQSPTEAVPAWIVQPNFEVMVYLDSASTRQIAFLEQYAERINAAQHTVQYRLTRDSVYEGLQSGSDVDSLLAGLSTGSRVPLPTNIVAEIRTWAALRERITVRRTAALLEFPNPVARQQALEQGLPGLAVGERFLLLSEPLANTQSEGKNEGKNEAKREGEKEDKAIDAAPTVIDYAAKPPGGCLMLSEEGVITLVAERHNLLTEGCLNLWAEREGDSTWQLTHKSVSGAVQRGRTLTELVTFLKERLAHNVPGILMVALRAWSGEPIKASVGDVVVVQCLQSDVLNALAASQSLRPYLLGSLGPETLLVKRADVEKVRAILTWAGITLSEKTVGVKI